MDNESGAPATKADLANAKAELKADMADMADQLMAHIDERLQASEERIINGIGELLNGFKHEMLKAFRSFAEADEKRLIEIEREAALRNRLMPPAA